MSLLSRYISSNLAISSSTPTLVSGDAASAFLVLRGGGGGEGVQAYPFEKKDSELGVGGEDQDTSRNFEGSFGSIHVILPM